MPNDSSANGGAPAAKRAKTEATKAEATKAEATKAEATKAEATKAEAGDTVQASAAHDPALL